MESLSGTWRKEMHGSGGEVEEEYKFYTSFIFKLHLIIKLEQLLMMKLMN